MEEKSFKGICYRFLYSLAWCFTLGVLLGLLHHLGYPLLQDKIEKIIIENSAFESFHLISMFSTLSLGLIVTFVGRTQGEISTLRNIFGYKASEVALALGAVFYGLLFGFSIAVFEWPLVALASYAFFVTVGIVSCLLWLSFFGNGIKSEMEARIFSALLVLVSVGVAWYEYFR